MVSPANILLPDRLIGKRGCGPYEGTALAVALYLPGARGPPSQ